MPGFSAAVATLETCSETERWGVSVLCAARVLIEHVMKMASGFALAVVGLLSAAGCGSEDRVRSGSDRPGEELGEPADGDANAPVEPDEPAGVTVRGGALFQGVKLPLFGEDAPTSTATVPVVIDRPGVFRLYVDLVSAGRAQETSVTFTYKAKDGSLKELTGTRLISKDSDDDDEKTCVDVALPAEVFHPGLEYAVTVSTKNTRLVARFPEAADTFAPLPADPLTETLRVVIVPVQYNADGSDRLPDTTATQVERLSDELHALYPVSKVEVTVRPQPLVWEQEIAANGQGWEELLYGVLQLRETDAAADDVYYYGAFNPSTSLQSFCSGGGCVLGLSELSTSVADAGRRGSIGLGYNGNEAAETFTHELGHAHGRYHAPCGGAGGPDRRFPYVGGGIGVAGWDVRTAEFVTAEGGRGGTKDFMGYCSPSWVSDYTWKALYTRITGINEKLGALSSVASVRYRLLRIEDGKAPRWLGTRSVRGAAFESTVTATLADGRARSLPQVELDHLPGHVVYVPVSLSGQSLRVPGLASAVTVP